MESNVTPSPGVPGGGRASVALASVFLSPSRCFQEISRGASWLLGFIVSVLLAVAGALLQRPFTEILAHSQLARMPEEQRQAAERMVGVQSTMQVVLAPAFVALGLLLGSLVFLGIVRAWGLRLRYKKVFTGMCYASIVTGLGGLLLGFLNRQRALAGDVTGVGDMPRIGLDLIGGDGFVRGVLSAVNPFTIWWLVILVYGIAVLAGRTPRQAMPAVVVAGCVWLLLTGLLTGLAFISPGS